MARTAEATDAPLDRLFKLLPAESTGAFLLVRGIFPYEPARTGIDASSVALAILTLIVIVATPFVYSRGQPERDPVGSAFITVSAVIWIMNIEVNRFVDLGQHLQALFGANILLEAVFTTQFLIGLLIVWVITLLPLAGFKLPANRESKK